MVSTKGRYALRLMIDLARQEPGTPIPLEQIAQRQEISKKYLEQIALQLSQSNMLRAVRGHQGGYRLIREPSEYTALEILRIAEGSLAPVACMDQEPNLCNRCAKCLTLPLWMGLDHLIQDYLGNITLQDLLDGKVPASES